ncbi:MAG TPA: hypothetical protein PLS35_02420, partial [Nitrospira sp.]|nr:hypothetical protein [Nitrospira sp.]
VVMQARASQNPVVSTIAKFTLPFVRTPVNILKQGIEYSPLGIVNLPGAANKSEKIAKILMGIGTTTAAASLLGQDRITWGTPTDKKEKEDFLAAGMQPYSVKIGDKWYSYSKLHPALAFNLALFAALHDANKRGEVDDTMLDKTLSGVAKWGGFFADQSYMKQIGDLMSAAKGDAEAGGKIIANYASQLIPARALMGWVNNIIDPVQRAADTDGSLLDQQMQWIMSQIPGLSKNVPARTDSKGAPIMKSNNILNAFSPVKVSTGNQTGEVRYNERVQANVKYAGERKEQRKEASAQQEKARVEYQRLLKLPKDQANAELDRIKAEDPRLYEDMATIHKSTVRNYTIDEENLRTLNIENGFRAAHIWAELQKMGSDEEKNAYLQDLEEKKIMTEDVSNQLAARYILEATSKMKTASEKNTFLDGLRKQGRLNKGVEQELRRLSSQ